MDGLQPAHARCGAATADTSCLSHMSLLLPLASPFRVRRVLLRPGTFLPCVSMNRGTLL